MDINENEEQIEELEPLADTAGLAVDPVEDHQAPADEEPVTLPDQDPPADDAGGTAGARPSRRAQSVQSDS